VHAVGRSSYGEVFVEAFPPQGFTEGDKVAGLFSFSSSANAL
jgi:hypothetical protein